MLRTNSALAHQKVPVKLAGESGQVVPDLAGNVFKEEVLFGLMIVKNIAQLLNLETPFVDKVVVWMQGYSGIEFIKNGRMNREAPLDQTGVPLRYGIRMIDQYLRVSNFVVFHI